MTRAYLAVSVLALACASNASAQSTAKTVRIQSEALGTRTFAVLLPLTYDQSTTPYPVLYLLHGGGQDHTAFMARPGFARRARQVEMIVVMPAADRGGLSPAAVGRYEDFIARELVPYVDMNFRTIPAASGRAIAGLSMGGMFAAGAGSRYPAVFGVVGAFSAALRGESPSPPAADLAPTFYISCGTLDPLLAVNRQWVQSLQAGNVPHEYHELRGYGHSWDFWDPQIDTFVHYLATARGWSVASGLRPE
jgi:enterochelin esterase-like enzyme